MSAIALSYNSLALDEKMKAKRKRLAQGRAFGVWAERLLKLLRALDFFVHILDIWRREILKSEALVFLRQR